MLLAVDVGNTNVVFALFDGREIRTRWRIATDPRRTGDEYAVWLMQLMAIEGIERGEVTAVIVSTVVPRARHNLEVLVEKYFGVTPLFAGEGAAAEGRHEERPARLVRGEHVLPQQSEELRRRIGMPLAERRAVGARPYAPPVRHYDEQPPVGGHDPPDLPQHLLPSTEP